MNYNEAAQYFMETGKSVSKISKENNLKCYKLFRTIKENHHVDIRAYSKKKLEEKYEQLYHVFTKSDVGIKDFCANNHISRPNFVKYIGERNKRICPIVTQKTFYHVNDNAFAAIHSEEQAYWLGFLYADGYNSGSYVQTTISYHDFNHLKKFRQFMQSNHPIRLKKQDNTVSLSVPSLKMCTDLAGVGCVKGKTYCSNFPCHSSLPNHLLRHFVRGYVDGDGCIGKIFIQDTTSVNSIQRKINKVSISVKMERVANKLKEAIRQICGVEAGIYHVNTSGTDQYEVYVEGQRDIRDFLDCLYKESTVYLDRKYKRYLKYILPSDLETDRIINAKLSGNVLPDLYPTEEEITRIIRTEGVQYELDYGNVVDRRKSSQGQSVEAEADR